MGERYRQDASNCAIKIPIRHLHSSPDGIKDFEPKATKFPVCRRCCGINAENLSEGWGYWHGTLPQLYESTSKCRLCNWIARSLAKSQKQPNLAPIDNFAIVLQLVKREISIKPQSRCGTTGRNDTRNQLSKIRVVIENLPPWNMSQDDRLINKAMEGKGYVDENIWQEEQELCVRGDGNEASKPGRDGGGPHRETNDRHSSHRTVQLDDCYLWCFTEEHDPARSVCHSYASLKSARILKHLFVLQQTDSHDALQKIPLLIQVSPRNRKWIQNTNSATLRKSVSLGKESNSGSHERTSLLFCSFP